MATEQDRAPLSTEVSSQRHPSDGSVQAQAAASGERLAIGESLSGRYRIERELGEGGMGVVYLVTDTQVAGEVFAIKVLIEDLHPEALDLLREEVHKTRRLSHPNIVDVHSVNVDGTKLYVLMEYLEGTSLNALLDEEFGRGESPGRRRKRVRTWPLPGPLKPTSSIRGDRLRMASGLLLVKPGQQRDVHLSDCLAFGLRHARPDARLLPGRLIADAPGYRVNAPIERLHAGGRAEVQIGKLDGLGANLITSMRVGSDQHARQRHRSGVTDDGAVSGLDIRVHDGLLCLVVGNFAAPSDRWLGQQSSGLGSEVSDRPTGRSLGRS
jgi:hypothetical protein